MIYMYAIPRALDRYRDLKLRGQMTYQDHTVHIPAEAADDQFVQNLGTLIRRLADEKPATRVPSRPETAPRCARAAEGSVLTQRQRENALRTRKAPLRGPCARIWGLHLHLPSALWPEMGKPKDTQDRMVPEKRRPTT